MKKISITAAAIAIGLAPFQASAQANVNSCSGIVGTGIQGLVECAVGFFNVAIYLIMALAVVYIVWGAFQLMREEKRDEGKNIILYGIIGLFVMISIWGLVNILDRTFNLSSEVPRQPVELIPAP